MAGLLSTVRSTFDTIRDSRKAGSVVYTMSDTLSSALAMFSLKYSSLLQFDTEARADEGVIRHNLTTLFGVSKAPSDTQMRDIIDPVDPALLRPAFRALHSSLQRGNGLKSLAWKEGNYLLSIDGTGVFASSKISCKHCCVKKRKSGEEFYHQLVAAAIVHPEHKRALPLDFEPITRHDGNTKNDCERNAGKRLLQSIREQYPDRKFVVLEDALAANGPHIRELQHHQMDFIIGAKPGSNASLFEEVFERLNRSECIESAPDDLNAKGLSCGYRFTNNLALNDSNPDLFVNFLEYWEFDKAGKQTIFSWVTNLPISAENAYEIAQAGRTRWKVGRVRGRARSSRLPASPLRTGLAPLSASGSPLRCGVPPSQHPRTRTIVGPRDTADRPLTMLPACAAFHRLSKVFTSLRSVNLSHKHTRAAPLRHVVSFPHLGLLRELRQSA